MALSLEDIYPLSPMQQGMLFHTLEAPTSGVYLEQASVELENLSVSALREAWKAVLRRHSVLRTSFIWEEIESPLQVVEREVDLPWSEHDWRDLTPLKRRQQLADYLAEDRIRGFDVTCAPLMRVALMHLEERRFQMVWTYHHLLLDGWSVPLLMSEVMRFYEALNAERPVYLPQPRPYADYIRWMQRQDLDKAERYWRGTLSGFRHVPSIPGARPPNSGRRSAQFGRENRLLSLEASRAINGFVRHHQLTLNTFVQGAWALLLSRYSGQQDVIFGATTAGRPAELGGVESMVGLFINTLPVRVQCDAEQTVAAYLQQLQKEQAEARNYEYAPLVQIQRWSEVPPGQPLFESILVFQNYPVDSIEKALSQASPDGLQANGFNTFEQDKFSLLALSAPGKQLTLQLTYAADIYAAATVERMAGHWERLLEEMTVSGDRRVGDLAMLPEAERHQVVLEWNRTERSYPGDLGIHELFEAQVLRSPDAVALVYGDQELSYGELNRRSNRLGRYLRELGVGPEVRVGLCVERSLEMVVGLLGILKAGGAYVPLDPEYPAERLAYMLEDTAAPVLLTQRHLQDRLPVSWAQAICLDRDWEELADKSEEDLSCVASGENAAYVIYTSGSTGQPKGVVVTHEGLGNYLRWSCAAYVGKEGVGALVHSPLGFDLTVTSIYVPLLTGGCIRLIEEEKKIEGLAEAIAAGTEFELLKVTPSHLDMLSVQLGEEILSKLHGALIVGGEALTETQIRGLKGATKLRLINEYGPTETVVGCSVYEVAAGSSLEGSVPIGRPISNTRIYVLDGGMEPVGIGIPGGRYIGGAGLAGGYLNRADLTAERFVPDPFSERGGERLYRTGDLGRWRPDGVLEYLGRIDDQVKVRGYPIEPGEIEAALRSHDQVEDAVVTVYGNDGNKKLLAYAVRRPNEQESAVSRNAHLEEWRYLYKATYRQDDLGPGNFNLQGWNSSYTGEPIAVEEMRIWVNETVTRLKELNPSRVVEIGCGTGLLLTKLAQACESYIGIDFSAEVLEQLKSYLSTQSDLMHVELRHGLAHELSGVGDDSVDLVILNSVVQYFPDVDYLLDVLSEAVRITRREGHIFIGDVRSLSLLEAYHTSVQLYKAAPEMTVEDLRRRIGQACRQEKELLLNAHLFE